MEYCVVFPSYGSPSFYENCLSVAVRSMQKTNPNLQIIIFHNGLKAIQMRKLRDCLFMNVNTKIFNVRHRPDLTEGTYFKYYIEKLTQYKKVLYLDADVVVLGDLIPLLEIDAPLVARTRFLPLSHEFQNVNLVVDQEPIFEGVKILQGGVLCFDPKFWAREKMLNQVLEIARKYGWSFFRNADQGILNIIAHRYKNFKRFPAEYNYCRYWDMLKKPTATIKKDKTGLKLAFQNKRQIKVLHWNGKIKPHEFDSAGFDLNLRQRLLYECYEQFC